ncbi:prepilin peptidase [Halosegnis sp.]|uniref:prepilin peptidase n=1 Tax=Halosegnis sp. TaxID=2864959 RepID=UPI0035D3E7DA
MSLAATLDTLFASRTTALCRLFALPVFALAAYRDVQTRRVRNELWVPLVALGLVLLVADAATALEADAVRRRLFLVHVGVSLGFVAPLGYAFWRVGGFGGADAKAIITLAVVFPEFPAYYLPGAVLPLVRPPLGVLSMTVLSNAVVVGATFPLALATRNLLDGHLRPLAFVGRPVSVPAVATEHGSLLETPDGLTRDGLDLDALRMYLRWRRATLSDLRADPDWYRDPASLPPEDERGDPTDGALTAGPPVTDGGDASEPAVRRIEHEDSWGAAAFLAALEGTAYGTTPEELRDGLDLLVARDEVWLTPGLPFIVPTFLGLVVAVTYGDLLFRLLRVLWGVP